MSVDRQSPTASASKIDTLAFHLHSVKLHMMRRIRREDNAFGVSAPHMSALSVVYFGAPRTIGEIDRAEQLRRRR